MKTYILKPAKDEHGRLIRVHMGRFENNVSKAIDQLSGICAGILADGEVSELEAKFFAERVREITLQEPVWPLTEICGEIDRIDASGRWGDTEREQLKMIMEKICGFKTTPDSGGTCSSTFALDSPPPDPVVFPGRNFNITGRFAFGSRISVQDAIRERGGTASDSPPTTQSHYLVIGTYATRDWVTANYGRKIERAVRLRKNGSGIAIISEEHWRKFLT